MECKVASSSPVGDKFFRHSFDLYRSNCAEDEQVVLSESVILWNFNFRNEGLVAIFKKKLVQLFVMFPSIVLPLMYIV